MTHCTATKNDGDPCRAKRLEGKEFCRWHDPESKQSRIDASHAGGRCTPGRSITPLDSQMSVQEAMARVDAAILSGELSAAQSQALSSLVRAKIALAKLANEEREDDTSIPAMSTGEIRRQVLTSCTTEELQEELSRRERG